MSIARAPGKLFVAGEFAVLEPGTPAILMAVDRYVTVTVSDPGESVVVVSSDLGPRRVRYRWHGDRLSASDGEPPAVLTHVVAAIEVMAQMLAERGLPVPALDVSVSSDLHDNGTKLGLGSSGAVTVATVAAVASFCGLDLSPDTRFRLSVLATVGIDVRSSCGDLAASAWGGWILYQAPDRAAVLDLFRRRGVEETLRAPWPGFQARRLRPPADLAVEVGWTGTPASTTTLVAGLDRRAWRGSESHRRFVSTTVDCVLASAAALDQADRPALLAQIRRLRHELARVDDEVGIGVFTPKLTALCAAAEAVGGAAKPSGAGGGDCGIALLAAEASRDVARVRQRWTRAGVLPLPIQPSPEGDEG